MKYFMVLLFVAAFVCGCAQRTPQSVIAISPTGSFAPGTGAALLAELNAQLPYRIAPKRFLCKVKGNKIVGWALLDDAKQEDLAKTGLKASKTLVLTQVEAVTPEFEQMFQKQWIEPEKVTVSKQ